LIKLYIISFLYLDYIIIIYISAHLDCHSNLARFGLPLCPVAVSRQRHQRVLRRALLLKI
jgi:hypothetical protein